MAPESELPALSLLFRVKSRKLASASWSPSCFSKVGVGMESPIARNVSVNYPHWPPLPPLHKKFGNSTGTITLAASASSASVHFTLYTWHSTLYTLHFTPRTLHFTLPLYTLHSTLYTPHFTPHAPCCTLYTLHFTLYTWHSTLQFCTWHSTLYTLHSTHTRQEIDPSSDRLGTESRTCITKEDQEVGESSTKYPSE